MISKEIIFFSNVLNPYQKDFLSEVSKRINIYSIFNEKNIKILHGKLNMIFVQKNISYLDYKNRKEFYIKIIKKYNFGNFLVGGYNIRDLFTILYLAKKFNEKVYIFF